MLKLKKGNFNGCCRIHRGWRISFVATKGRFSQNDICLDRTASWKEISLFTRLSWIE